MAFNRKFFNLFKYLLPKSNVFILLYEKLITRFFEGLSAIPDDFRTYIDNIFMDLFPTSTRSPELWENQFGITDPNPDNNIRRINIDTNWKLKGGQYKQYLQNRLQEAGFDVQVHENFPIVDPDIFVNSAFVATCGNAWAVCGNDDAYCGRTGGLLLVNGYIPETSSVRDFLAVCGEAYCGYQYSLCGYFETFIIQEKVYSVPDDSDYWGAFIFIGGDATRDPVTHELTNIELVEIDESRKTDFETIILKIKPANVWAGLVIDYIS